MKARSILSLHGIAVVTVTSLATGLGCSLLTGCGVGADDLSSLGSGITSGSDTSGSTSTSTGTTGGRYTGTHSATVYKLLSYVNYSVGKGVSSVGRTRGTPPYGSNYDLIKNGSCISDQYVAAAIVLAWGAAQYASVGDTVNAQKSANSMCDNLKQKDALCKGPNTPTFSGSTACVSDQVYPCGPNGPGTATTQNCP